MPAQEEPRGAVDRRAAFERCSGTKGVTKLMPQPLPHIPSGTPAGRITRPTLAKAKVSESIRVENELLEGWVSWVTSISFHCYGCES
jgi:hypothetical protein